MAVSEVKRQGEIKRVDQWGVYIEITAMARLVRYWTPTASPCR